MALSRALLWTLLALAALPAAAAPTWDFETGDLQGWQVAQGGFPRLLCDRAQYHHTGGPYNKQGTYFLSTLETQAYTPDDAPTGIVESPVFTLDIPYLSLLVGGGAGPGEYVALVQVDEDIELRRAQGVNDQVMQRRIWDVREFAGQQVRLRIVDRETGGWGHTTLDDIRPPTDAELATITPDASAPPQTDINALRAECTKAATSLRLALDDLAQTYGERFAAAASYRQRLGDLEARLAALPDKGARKPLTALHAEVQALAAEVFIASPLLADTPLLYVARNQYRRDHHNTETMFQNGAEHGGFVGGGALRRVWLGPGGHTETLLDAPQGMVRDPDLHFDGDRVLFSYRRDASDDYHIWEMRADGSGLRQLTEGSGLSDIDPIYLANDDILFASTRDPKVCACNVHVQANLFRMSPEGRSIRQIGRNTLFEGHPCLLPDGRVLYSRWEYVDKHFGPAQGLWTTNPDGTYHATYYHNNAWWPGAILDGHPVPGTDWVMGTLSSCHAPPFGEAAIIDRKVGFEGTAPLLKSWPQTPVNRDGYDHIWGLPYRYEDPCPLTDKYALVARCIEPAGPSEGDDHWGIFLVDTFGNEVLIHQDAQYGCFDPMPLRARPRPPVIPDRVDYAQPPQGLFYVQDVYRGTGMSAVARGAVKWLRVVESPPKRYISFGDFNNQARQAPVMNWADVVNKRIIGRVPVEADGSAYFTAPSDTFLFFQLLDERGMMVHSMRSGTMAMPGETVGCAGCHDERNTAPPSGSRPAALRRAPSTPEPWHGPAREFSFAAEVQPVFDRHCVRCHDFGKPAGRKLNLSGDDTLLFNVSYLDLHRRSGSVFTLDPPDSPLRPIKVVNHGPPEVLPPYSWGASRSALVRVLLDGDHHGVKLDAESLDRIITWVDMNGVYYGSFACERPGNVGGRSPLDGGQIARLRDLTGVDVANELAGTWVDLTRPELSPCLTVNLPPEAGGSADPGAARFASLDDPAYREALGIIEAGRAELARLPRMDMPGGVPADICLADDRRIAARQAQEQEVRAELGQRR